MPSIKYYKHKAYEVRKVCTICGSGADEAFILQPVGCIINEIVICLDTCWKKADRYGYILREDEDTESYLNFS